MLDDFSARVESSLWVEGNAACGAYTGLEASLAKYQNPREADALTKIQEELDETKIILVIIVLIIFQIHRIPYLKDVVYAAQHH